MSQLFFISFFLNLLIFQLSSTFCFLPSSDYDRESFELEILRFYKSSLVGTLNIGAVPTRVCLGSMLMTHSSAWTNQQLLPFEKEKQANHVIDTYSVSNLGYFVSK